MTPLQTLERKLSEAAGPLTDDELCEATPYPLLGLTERSGMERDQLREWLRGAVCESSIDAAVAIAEFLLPGWSWNVEKFPKLRAQLAEPVETQFGSGIGIRAQETGATPALALCLAVIRALIAKQDQAKVGAG